MIDSIDQFFFQPEVRFLFSQCAIFRTNNNLLAQRSPHKFMFCLAHNSKKNNKVRRQHPKVPFLCHRTIPTRTKVHTATSRSDSQFAIAPSFTSMKQTRMINSTEQILFLVPTIKEEHHQEMDMHRLSENDLKTLRTKDPFMYHSIPEVHTATFTLQEVEYANTISSQASSTVTRKSRVSTECHPSLLTKEFLQDEEFESLWSALINRLADIVESDI